MRRQPLALLLTTPLHHESVTRCCPSSMKSLSLAQYLAPIDKAFAEQLLAAMRMCTHKQSFHQCGTKMQVLAKARSWCPEPHRVFIGGGSSSSAAGAGVQPDATRPESLWGWSGAFGPWQAAPNHRQSLQQAESQGLRYCLLAPLQASLFLLRFQHRQHEPGSDRA